MSEYQKMSDDFVSVEPAEVGSGWNVVVWDIDGRRWNVDGYNTRVRAEGIREIIARALDSWDVRPDM